MSPRIAKAVTFIAAAAITSVFFINFCNFVFGCGCASLWNGADTHCNVHQQGVHRCPWCAHGVVASTIPWLVMVAAQAAIAFHPRPISPALRLAAAIAAFPVVGGVLAAIYKWATGY